jgi:hypothetical protein
LSILTFLDFVSVAMYFLGRACWIVRKLDGSPGRLAVFEDVVRKNFKVRISYGLYKNAPDFLKTFLLILYGAKCYLSVNWRGAGRVDLACFASYPNEQVAIRHVRRRLRGLALADLTIAKRNCFALTSLMAVPALLLLAFRWRRVARRLVRRFHFLPACRIFSTITYHARFRDLLKGRDVPAVFIANHYSPECLGLAVAAHQSGRKVLFTNHANATWEEGYVPPLYSDLAAVTSRAVLDIYTQARRRRIDAVFIPPASPQQAMRTRFGAGEEVTVGIFLTALTNMDRLQALVTQLKADPLVTRILIRPHPVKVINEDLSGLCTADDRVRETGSMLLSDNIAQCDLAICGNSTVTIEILRGGRPVFYDAGLDRCRYDLNGYLKRALVPPLPEGVDAASLKSLGGVYEAPTWQEKMRYFDASYGRNEEAMFEQLNAAVRQAVRRSLRPQRHWGWRPAGSEEALGPAKAAERPFRA